jgi:hypothetical protein
MRLALNFPRRAFVFSAACALSTLLPLLALTRDAPIPETHGIIVAGMDRSKNSFGGRIRLNGRRIRCSDG